MRDAGYLAGFESEELLMLRRSIDEWFVFVTMISRPDTSGMNALAGRSVYIMIRYVISTVVDRAMISCRSRLARLVYSKGGREVEPLTPLTHLRMLLPNSRWTSYSSRSN